MEKLDRKYAIELNAIKGAVQSSDLLEKYLDDEEEESYQALREHFEPRIETIYTKVASQNPLQLIALEEMLLEDGFEGLYLSRVLGYTVLRGEIDDQYRYKRPQDHFKKVLLAICRSSNFESISLRIGQGVQIGFGLSSNIWITNLIEQVDAKRVKAFLKAQVLSKYREIANRRVAYEKYNRQFASVNFQSAEFPTTTGSLKVLFSSLLYFLKWRVHIKENNHSLIARLKEFLDNEAFENNSEYVAVLHMFANFYDYSGDTQWFRNKFNASRKNFADFNTEYFEFHKQLLQGPIQVDAVADGAVFAVLDTSIDDDLTAYYTLMSNIHRVGYVHDDSIEMVRTFYDSHEGLSTINECLRLTIMGHFHHLFDNLDVEMYSDYFEMNKIFAVYMQIFNNEQFNLHIKKSSLTYIAKLLKRYTDKRGKDYQEIKKFVSQTFLDFGFMNEKELVELFKTRRKRKTA